MCNCLVKLEKRKEKQQQTNPCVFVFLQDQGRSGFLWKLNTPKVIAGDAVAVLAEGSPRLLTAGTLAELVTAPEITERRGVMVFSRIQYLLTHLAPDQPLPFSYEIPCEGK